MMYRNFFLFIVAVAVFAAAPDISANSMGHWLNLFFTAAGVVLFREWNKIRFQRFSREAAQKNISLFQVRHNLEQLVSGQLVLALVLFVCLVVFFDLKSLFVALPVMGKSMFAVNTLGLGLFYFLCAAVWYWSYSSLGHVISAAESAQKHMSAHIKFNLVIVLPWLLLSLATDTGVLLGVFSNGTSSGGSWYFQLAVVGVFVVMLAIFSPWVVTRLWDCAPLEDRKLVQRIESFSSSRGVRFKKIFSWNALNQGLVTAGVIGIVPWFRYLMLTPGLIHMLDEDELTAVVSHEIGHVKKHHLWLYLYFFAGFAALSFSVLDRVVWMFAGSSLGFPLLLAPDGSLNMTRLGWISLIFSLLLFVLYFRFVFGYFMRNFERQADLYCFEAGVDSSSLVSSFSKLGGATGERRGASNWHHYSLFQRMKFLEQCREHPELIKEHDRKLKRNLGIFSVCLLLVVLSGILPNLRGESRVNLRRITAVLEKQALRRPSDPAVFALLGNAYHEMGLQQKARKAYYYSLRLYYRQPDTLNNLAWLLLTARDKNLRDYKTALKLARDAVSLKSEQHILDTLAEAYLANGMVDQAVKTARMALEKAGGNREYYKKQLKKMRQKALEKKAQTI